MNSLRLITKKLLMPTFITSISLIFSIEAKAKPWDREPFGTNIPYDDERHYIEADGSSGQYKDIDFVIYPDGEGFSGDGGADFSNLHNCDELLNHSNQLESICRVDTENHIVRFGKGVSGFFIIDVYCDNQPCRYPYVRIDHLYGDEVGTHLDLKFYDRLW